MTLLAYFSKTQNCCLFNLQYKPNLSGPFKIEENYSKSNSSVSKTGLGIKVIFERVWSYRVLCSKILVGVGLVTHRRMRVTDHESQVNITELEPEHILWHIPWISLLWDSRSQLFKKREIPFFSNLIIMLLYLFFSYQRKLPWLWQKWVNWEESEGSMVNSCPL